MYLFSSKSRQHILLFYVLLVLVLIPKSNHTFTMCLGHNYNYHSLRPCVTWWNQRKNTWSSVLPGIRETHLKVPITFLRQTLVDIGQEDQDIRSWWESDTSRVFVGPYCPLAVTSRLKIAGCLTPPLFFLPFNTWSWMLHLFCEPSPDASPTPSLTPLPHRSHSARCSSALDVVARKPRRSKSYQGPSNGWPHVTSRCGWSL